MRSASSLQLETPIRTAPKNTAAAGLNVTFVLPSTNRSGGVRVTALMGNLLRDLGHHVRIAIRREGLGSPSNLWGAVRYQVLRAWGVSNEDWVKSFQGPVETFSRNLDELRYEPGEIVIAVGTRSVDYVEAMRPDVIKMRYCHGFAGDEPEINRRAWSGPMPTIVVSEGLVEKIRTQFQQEAYGVVPNGCEADLYFVEERFPRNGVGTVFNLHYNKAPEFTISVMQGIAKRLPEAPQFIFGTAKCPPEFRKEHYSWYPSVEKAREFYNRCKVWVVASRIEGFCLPMVEAMACGTVVVTTDHDGVPGLMEHGKNSFVVPFGDQQAIEDYVAAVYNDEELRRRIVQNGFETLKRFTWNSAARKMEECLLKIAAERGVIPAYADAKDAVADARPGHG